jgi:hypothetical protein
MTHWSSQTSVVYETQGADTTLSRGTVVTAAASANTKGSWVAIGSATSRDYQCIWVSMTAQNAQTDYLVDIGITDGANTFVIMPNLRLAALAGNLTGAVHVTLPLHIAGGAQLAARCQATTASRFCLITIVGSSMGYNGAPGYAYGSQLYTDGTSRGEDFDPTVANTMTAWNNLATTATAISAILLAVGPAAQVTRAAGRNYMLDVSQGAAASEMVILDNIPLAQSLIDQRPLPCYLGPFIISIGRTQRVNARVQTTDVTAGERKIDVACWGFVA